jgi:hypothetical protein
MLPLQEDDNRRHFLGFGQADRKRRSQSGSAGVGASGAAVYNFLTSVHLSARAGRYERVVYSALDALPYSGTGTRPTLVAK